MTKMVLKLSIVDEKSKRKALKVVAGVTGVDSVAVDMKESKIIVIGVADPVFVTAKLRKFGFGYAELLSVGPEKEEKKEGEKKDVKKEEKKAESPTVVYLHDSYIYDNVLSDENPNACTIC